jgi:serine/threonine-protein kinase
MAMELLEGIDLRQAVDDNRLGTLEEKLDVMDSVLAALDYAHAKGVVHRDIKPANIHLGRNRQVKIMDFGLARVSSSEMTQEGIVLGTPNYMSPEQALGDKVDGRSDLFSTGAVLYELLTGHKPFEADTTPSVLFQVVHKQPPPVRRWAPDLPASIVAVVNRALEKDLARRFGSAGDMRAAPTAGDAAPARAVAAARAAAAAADGGAALAQLGPRQRPARALALGEIRVVERRRGPSARAAHVDPAAADRGRARGLRARRGGRRLLASRAAGPRAPSARPRGARHGRHRSAHAGAREQAAAPGAGRARRQELPLGARRGPRRAQALSRP